MKGGPATLSFMVFIFNELYGNSDISKIRVVPNSGLRKFRHGKSMALSTKTVVVVVDGRAC